MSQDIWADAPTDATHYDPIDKNFLRELDRVLLLHHNTKGWGYTHHSQYASKVEDCRQPLMLRPAWTGEGLPPAGTVCERRFPNVGGSSWRQITILFIGDQKIFYRDEAGEEWANLPDDVELRPIRTAEQIAADERLHKVRNAFTAIGRGIEKWNTSTDCSAAMRATVEAMIDAGYRKEPTQ
jgi:hypothetical protein